MLPHCVSLFSAERSPQPAILYHASTFEPVLPTHAVPPAKDQASIGRNESLCLLLQWNVKHERDLRNWWVPVQGVYQFVCC